VYTYIHTLTAHPYVIIKRRPWQSTQTQTKDSRRAPWTQTVIETSRYTVHTHAWHSDHYMPVSSTLLRVVHIQKYCDQTIQLENNCMSLYYRVLNCSPAAKLIGACVHAPPHNSQPAAARGNHTYRYKERHREIERHIRDAVIVQSATARPKCGNLFFDYRIG